VRACCDGSKEDGDTKEEAEEERRGEEQGNDETQQRNWGKQEANGGNEIWLHNCSVREHLEEAVPPVHLPHVCITLHLFVEGRPGRRMLRIRAAMQIE
jgi:hypothetical protein